MRGNPEARTSQCDADSSYATFLVYQSGCENQHETPFVPFVTLATRANGVVSRREFSRWCVVLCRLLFHWVTAMPGSCPTWVSRSATVRGVSCGNGRLISAHERSPGRKPGLHLTCRDNRI